MVKISVMYPNRPGAWFDFNYFTTHRLPKNVALLAEHASFRGAAVEQGLHGRRKGEPAAYTAVCHYLFETEEDILSAYAPHAEAMEADRANYTDIEPMVQISAIVIAD